MKTLAFRACVALTCTYRWCLSGTPVYNGIADFNALTIFLHLEPFYSSHTTNPRNELFRVALTNLMKTGNKKAAQHFRTLVKMTSLRRLKKNILSLEVPPKSETLVTVTLSEAERVAYNATADAIRSYVDEYDRRDNDENGGGGGGGVFLLFVLRLRQICLDIRLVPPAEIVRLLSRMVVTTSPSESDENEDAIGYSKSRHKEAVQRLTETEQKELFEKLNDLFHRATGLTQAASELVLTLADTENTATPCARDTDEDDGSGEECPVCMNTIGEELAVIVKTCRHVLCQIW